MNFGKILKRYRIDDPDRFRLGSVDTADTGGLDLDKDDGKTMLAEDTERLADLQQRLYAHDRWALLVVLQGMDTAGKDGVIKHMMGGLNPQGCEVHPFKAPTSRELDHDFLWRAAVRLPARGDINIFNRSYYEEVLVVRVHPEILAGQKLPASLVTRHVWTERYDDINAFERYLARNGTLIRKFFLHVSKEEQRRRFLARLDDPAKNWKFASADLAERDRWDDYMKAYEQALSKTSTNHAPWFIVPADHKWFTRLAIARLVVEALEGLDLAFPKASRAHLGELAEARKRLESGA